MEKLIYLDNAATTQVSEEVLNAMFPFLGKHTAIHLQYIDLPKRVRQQLTMQESKRLS